MNKTWHENHRMPKRATREVRLKWHQQHAKACGCRPMPSEQAIREVAFNYGYVDVKVCAVDAIWSGLKLVVRKELR